MRTLEDFALTFFEIKWPKRKQIGKANKYHQPNTTKNTFSYIFSRTKQSQTKQLSVQLTKHKNKNKPKHYH